MQNSTRVLQLCRFVIAFIWIYQGVVPKWLGPHQDELTMNMALGLDVTQARTLAYAGGAFEVLLGIGVLAFYRQRWPYWATIGAMLLLYAFTLVYAPQFAISAFNSTTTNLAVCTLSVIALLELNRRKLGARQP